MDVGCYLIHAARFMFAEEPRWVFGLVSKDPDMGVDRLISAVLDFPSGHATFTCSTQLVPHQRMQFFGSLGRVEIEIPFNAPNDRPCRLFVDDSGDVFGSGVKVETLEVCDQCTIQGDFFSRAIREGGEVPVPVADAVRNMAVIEAVLRSAESGRWERPELINDSD